ncbi:hypothetical protein F2Q69_00048139 [Brassica cretica]|uniref:Uncharacterized protein n=1 Tax=Brassica cretica TaxID=69181 RepID=A0A8S9Q2P2_BRACR|nr:hypothetical protein F2Q69_00048139 [Brassica cretica]
MEKRCVDKKKEVSAEIQHQEVVANLDLLNEIENEGLVVDEEIIRLKEIEKDCEAIASLAAVPDWSVAGLDLPEVSEDLVVNDEAEDSEVFAFSLIDISSRRVGLRESERVRGRNGSVVVERTCSGDVSGLVTEVLRKETRLPRAPVSGEGKDLGGEKVAVRTSSNSPTGSEVRDRPPKKTRVTSADHRPGVLGDGSVAKPFHWQFSHSKDCPIMENPNSVAHLAMEANNEFAATLERRLQDVTRSDELYEIKKVVLELKLSLKMAHDREHANAAQLAAAEKLGNQAASLEARLRVVSNERKSALEQEKWEKKKAAADWEARLKEVMANIDLQKEIMNNNLLASDELLRLRAKEVELGSELDVLAVSDFSVGKLDLPQISEDLPVSSLRKFLLR